MPATTIGPAVERDVAQPLVLSSAGLLVMAYTTEPGDAPPALDDGVQYGTEVGVLLCFLVVAGRVLSRRWVARSS